MLEKNLENVNTIQIFFDFLGELIKFNRFTMKILVNELEQKNYEKRFLKAMMEDLVNSNVLIRSIILSYAKIQANSLKNSHIPCKEHEMKLMVFVEENLFEIAIRLIKSVTKSKLSSDSNLFTYFLDICCLNTFLIICIIFKQKGEFKEKIRLFLEELAEEELLSSLEKIIKTWQYYYTKRTKETFRLELSTNIPINSLFNIKNSLQKESILFLLLVEKFEVGEVGSKVLRDRKMKLEDLRS